jgi:uncharacterized membrane protein
MLVEHLIYSAAIALLIGMIFLRYTGKDPSWIIVVMTVAPDTDYVIREIMLAFNMSGQFMIYHGSFHNIISLIYISFIVALIFSRIGVSYTSAVICSMIGMFSHFIEDFIVYPPAYAYFYPFSSIDYGINFIPETRDLVIAGSEVLVVGLVLLVVSMCIKKYFENGWTISGYIDGWIKVGKQIITGCLKYGIE